MPFFGYSTEMNLGPSTKARGQAGHICSASASRWVSSRTSGRSSWAATLDQAEAANGIEGLYRQRRSPLADPDHGTGFTGHGTIVRPRLGVGRKQPSCIPKGDPGASDKPRKRWATSWRDARDEIGGGRGSARGLPWFRWMGLGGKVHAGSGAPSVVTGSLWTVRGRNQVWCWDPRCGSCPLLLRARVSVS